MRLLPALLIACFAALAAPSAEAFSSGSYGQNRPPSPSLEWNSIASERFHIAYPKGAEELARSALTTAEEAADEMEKRLGLRLEKAGAWFVFPSRYAAAASNIPASGVDTRLRAWSPLLRRRKMIVFDGLEADFRRSVRYFAARELQQQILYPNGGWEAVGLGPLFHPPDWFLEGTALYLAGPGRLREEAVLRGASLNNQLDSLDRLNDFNALARRGGDLELAAAQGYSAAAYISNQYGDRALGQLLTAVAQERTGDMNKPLQKILGIDFETFNKRWQRDAKKKYWPLIRAKEPIDSAARALPVSVPAHTYSPAWSPKGEALAAVVRSYRRDEVWLLSARDGSMIQNISKSARRQFDSMPVRGRALAWTPDGDAVLYIGRKGPRLRLIVSDVVSGELRRCIDLPFKEAHSPAVYPDGKRVLLAASLDGQTDLFEVALNGAEEAAAPRRLTNDAHYDSSPVIDPTGKTALYASERAGRSRLVYLDLETGRQTELLDGAGGVYDPFWAKEPGAFYFTAEWSGARDIYLFQTDAEEKRSDPQRITNFLAGASTPAVSPDGSQIAFSSLHRGLETLFSLPMDQAEREPSAPPAPPEQSETIETADARETPPAQPLPFGFTLDGLSFRLYTPNDGAARAALEVLAASWTGDFRLRALAVPSAKTAPSAAVQMEWLKRPVKYRLAVDRLERLHRDETGILKRQTESSAAFSAEYPLSRVKRIEASLGGVRAPLRYRHDARGIDADILKPVHTAFLGVSIVHDNASVSSAFGPVAGTRFRIEGSAVRGGDGVNALTFSADARLYTLLGRSAVFAGRIAAFHSGGAAPELAYLGGHTSLRGSRFEAFSGTRAAFSSLELRVPFVRELSLSWPARLRLRSIRGVLFMDAGAAWQRGEKPRAARVVDGQTRLDDLNWQFGFGARARILGHQLRWDLARGHDLVKASEWRGLFRIDRDF
ncbi:MAG: BamA/TamA family outer membrane protein [Candidatus Poribacteria bacterium]|nr:BamA/TamA family outer membrane protein [Candidatus Poribacteria bacterium]